MGTGKTLAARPRSQEPELGALPPRWVGSAVTAVRLLARRSFTSTWALHGCRHLPHGPSLSPSGPAPAPRICVPAPKVPGKPSGAGGRGGAFRGGRRVRSGWEPKHLESRTEIPCS